MENEREGYNIWVRWRGDVKQRRSEVAVGKIGRNLKNLLDMEGRVATTKGKKGVGL